MIQRKTITALVIGNALEWYDFVIYSFMTIYIAKVIFPSANEITSLLATTATFGVAFFMRPLGGIALGIYADKKGRKPAITAVIALMTIALLLIATVPSYLQIGIAAPIVILLARLLQGFAAGGEFGTSTALLTELTPAHQHGFYCSWQMVGQTTGMLLGSIAGMILTHFLDAQQLLSWGWRIPFICGLIIAPFGFYLRRNLNETVFQNKTSSGQFSKKIKNHTKQIFIATGLVAGGTAASYINLSHMPTFAHEYLQMNMNDAFTGVTLGGIAIVTLIPFFGWLSDQIGRKKILLTAIFSYLILIYPLFHWLQQTPSLAHLILVQAMICTLLAAYFGVFAAIVSELFPAEIRSTSLSISYNSAVMLFGGFAQFIVTYLIQTLGTPLAVTYYLVFAISISLIAAFCYQEKEEEYEHTELAVPTHSV
jgi:MHS family proline/betaine transporter-like MFS transporter